MSNENKVQDDFEQSNAVQYQQNTSLQNLKKKAVGKDIVSLARYNSLKLIKKDVLSKGILFKFFKLQANLVLNILSIVI